MVTRSKNNSELQLKDIEMSIKDKIMDLLSKLRGFKFVRTLLLQFQKKEREN